MDLRGVTVSFELGEAGALLTHDEVTYAYNHFVQKINEYLRSDEGLLAAFGGHAYGDNENKDSEFNFKGNANDFKNILVLLDEQPSDSQLSGIFKGERHGKIADALFTDAEVVKYGITPSIRYIMSALDVAAGGEYSDALIKEYKKSIPSASDDITRDPSFLFKEENGIRNNILKRKIIQYALARKEGNLPYQPDVEDDRHLVEWAAKKYLFIQSDDRAQTNQKKEALLELGKMLNSESKIPMKVLTNSVVKNLLAYINEEQNELDPQLFHDIGKLVRDLISCSDNRDLYRIYDKSFEMSNMLRERRVNIDLYSILSRFQKSYNRRAIFKMKKIDEGITEVAQQLQIYILDQIKKSGSKNENVDDLKKVINQIGLMQVDDQTKLTELCAAIQNTLAIKSTRSIFGESKLEACLIQILDKIRKDKTFSFLNSPTPMNNISKRGTTK